MIPNCQINCGDALEKLRELPDESVHCCVTSPPYWGLRDYGTAQWEGGENGCDHKGNPLCSDKSTLAGYSSEDIKLRTFAQPFRDICGKCGAKRIDSQLGLEKTPLEYVAKMVEVFREVRRVLRKDGTLWLNLGDSYASGEVGRHDKITPGSVVGNDEKYNGVKRQQTKLETGLKPKDLCGIPWRVAFALQSDGWWLRSDIIWAKPNPMPESCTDRPTKSHEYLFLLTKSASYFYDSEAIKEPMQDITYWRLTQPNFENQTGGPKDPMTGNRSHKKTLNNQHEKLIAQEKWKSRFEGFEEWKKNNAGRNKRSVWTVATNPYSDWNYDFEKADYVGADGRPYKVSEDCPIHALRRVSEIRQMGVCDGQLIANEKRSPDNATYHDPEPLPESASIPYRDAAQLDLEASFAPTLENKNASKTFVARKDKNQNPLRTSGMVETPVCNSDSSHRESAQIAIDHSNETRKTDRAALTNLSCNASEETLFRIDDIAGKPSRTRAQVRIDLGKCTCQLSMQSHFATFPPDLIKPCILAGTSAKGCCAKCGSPWERVIEKSGGTIGQSWHNHENDLGRGQRGGDNGNVAADAWARGDYKVKTIGWQPTCKHSLGGDVLPCTVLDPFAGSGTTGAVALELGRSAILIELNPAYIPLIENRCNTTLGLALA